MFVTVDQHTIAMSDWNTVQEPNDPPPFGTPRPTTLVPSKDRQRASTIVLLGELKAIVEAWEKLPGGTHPHEVVEQWLWNDMKPAIDRIRSIIK